MTAYELLSVAKRYVAEATEATHSAQMAGLTPEDEEACMEYLRNKLAGMEQLLNRLEKAYEEAEGIV